MHLATTAAAIGYAHSHPYFTNWTQLNDGKGCWGHKNWRAGDDRDKNRENQDFSGVDKSFAKNQQRPLYLRAYNAYGTWKIFKVYRKNSQGKWRSEDI